MSDFLTGEPIPQWFLMFNDYMKHKWGPLGDKLMSAELNNEIMMIGSYILKEN